MRAAIAILLFIMIVPLVGQERVSNICGLENTAFADGEALRYKLYYNLSFIWIPAGEAIFRLVETDSTYEATVVGRSYGSYDNIFKVRDEFSSTIDRESMRPLTFVRNVEEGDHLRFDSLAFDYRAGLIYSHNGRSRQTAVVDTMLLETCTQDLVSIMYNLRNIDTKHLSRGYEVLSTIFFDKEYAPVQLTYLKKEKKAIRGLGKFLTLKVRPEVIIGSVFKEGDVMHVWISDDDNKIPLQIESPIMVGKVKAILAEHKGLQYPMARIK